MQLLWKWMPQFLIIYVIVQIGYGCRSNYEPLEVSLYTNCNYTETKFELTKYVDTTNYSVLKEFELLEPQISIPYKI